MEEARQIKSNEFPMNPGDTLGLGKDCVLGLEVVIPQYCPSCLLEMEGTAFIQPDGLAVCTNCHYKLVEEQKAKEAAEEAEQERIKAQKEADAAAAAEKAAADARAKEAAEKARREAEAKAAKLKRLEEEKKERQRKLEEERIAEQKRVDEENRKRNNRCCEVCGKALSNSDMPGICISCLNDPMKLFLFLMDQAKAGVGDAREIAGYKNIKMLGQGGMGQVWLVEEEATGKRMALKLMLPKAAANPQSRDMFLREAHLGGQLNHKNVVRQYKCGQSGDTYFILMEFCEGGSVDDLLAKSGGRLKVDAATDIIMQVLDGLIYAHNVDISVKLKNGKTVDAKGIVHRDFKPGNIFLTGSAGNYTAKVADFGLAKAFETSGLSGHTRTGQAAGTPVFMPRQQILNFKYAKPAVDVWAAAATYYCLLTGQVPKNLPGRQDVFTEALNNTAVPILKINPSIPKKLAEVIDRALLEKPDIGVQSAAEFKKMIKSTL
jgi:serine/threonine-protein kinase